jgi:serine/threonine protein kinase
LRFERETKALQALDHPNILKIFHTQLTPPNKEKPFFVAEYCAGKSLQDLGANSFKDDVGKSANTLLPVVRGLEEAHRKNIFHRDIKPPNILFREDGTPVIGDFGICYMEDGANVTLSEGGMGSKNFIAPEMEPGASGVPSEKTDVYSLAKVLYWMVSGGREFSRENHRGNSLDLASTPARQRFHHLHMFLDKFLQNDPQKRKSLSDFRRDLEELVHLVEGNYAPLLSGLRIKCRFCGLGTYDRSTNGPGRAIPDAGLSGVSGTYIVAMWCDRCGHIQTFNLKASGYREWWNGRNDL